MTDRLAARFAACARDGRAALITFVTAGDPSLGVTAALLDALVANGADIIELGMPFTDPMADGPAIQAANIRALAGGVTLTDIIAVVAAFRARDAQTPIILMGYANPVLSFGAERFARAAAEAGVDGVIIVDLPPEEDLDLGPQLRAEKLHLVRLATPTTTAARLPAVLNGAGGFLYYVSVAGITGVQQADSADTAAAVERLRVATELPIAVGFGIRSPEQAAAVARVADGVVVGSAIVAQVAEAADAHANDIAARVGAYVRTLADAVRSARGSLAA